MTLIKDHEKYQPRQPNRVSSRLTLSAGKHPITFCWLENSNFRHLWLAANCGEKEIQFLQLWSEAWDQVWVSLLFKGGKERFRSVRTPPWQPAGYFWCVLIIKENSNQSIQLNFSNMISLKDHSLKVFSKCICHCLYICLRRCLFVGQVMFVQLLEMISCMIVVIKCARKWSAPPLLYLLSLEIVRTPAEKRTIRLSPKESKIYSFRKASDEFYFIKDRND